ncbi:MAG: family 78 glycoside hydrolase catalytic domain [Balneolaceae bacterium]|nr:family 78 glycoside hydrolase catalytic domain [Balneolaceae bacterium]
MSFQIEKEMAAAHLYVTGVGYYEAYLNGEKVGDHVLDPAITDYNDRVLYETFEVTSQLQEGENAIGFWLGNGAWRINRNEERWTWYGLNNNFGKPMGLAQLHIHFKNGTDTVFTTGSSWTTSSSPITYNNVYGGEDYDARLEQEGWNQVGFDESSWEPVELVNDPGLILDSQVMPPIRVMQTIQPVKKTQPGDSTYLFDMGQNFPGWWRIQVEGEPGTELTIRGAETLNDSLFPTPLKPGDSLSTHNVYHRDVWTSYTMKGEGQETYEPRFFYTGLRYVEVKVDQPGQLNSLQVSGRVVHSDIPRNGHFTSTDTLLNKIYEAAIWSQWGNLHGYPTDCPHREKGGYNGDGQVIAEASMHDFHMHSFYEKWIMDMRDSQYENGRIPNTSPAMLGGTGGGIAWGSAYILIPWWMHQYYADNRILQEHYPSMKRYMGYLENLASQNDENPEESFIINEFGGHWDSIGEWEAPVRERNGPVNPLTHTYYWYLDSITFAKIAETLGEKEDQQYYLSLADSIKTAFNEKFFNPQTNLYGTDEPYQTYLLFALHGDLVPEDHRQAVLDNLINDIMVKSEGHLGTGILGTKHLFSVLTNEGREDVIHTMVTQKTFPSWGYWIENGATTLWENWRGESSHNHQMFGSANEYLYKYLAGIRAPTDSVTTAGYKQILIKPYIPENLYHAEASVETMNGMVASSWKKTDQQLELNVTIPPNSTGKVSIPDLGNEKVTIREGEIVVWNSNGRLAEGNHISNGTREEGYVTFDVSSGTYSFTLSVH